MLRVRGYCSLSLSVMMGNGSYRVFGMLIRKTNRVGLMCLETSYPKVAEFLGTYGEEILVYMRYRIITVKECA